MKLGLKLNTKDLGIRGWSIYFDRQYNSYVVVKTSFFGLVKKQVARFQTIDAARKFITFMANPMYAFKNLGCTKLTRKWIQDDLKTIADNMYNLI